MNFSQLRCFVTLVEMGSFTEAAYMLGLTQSTVSHALSALERELGVTLLERNRKGVVALTTVGHAIIPHARALLTQVEAIEQEAKATRGEASGKLRLGMVLSFCPEVLVDVLTRFRASYPDIEVVLFEGTIHEVEEWMRSSIIDVGFVLHPTKGMESTLITTDELCVVVAPEHRLRAKPSVTPKELCEEGLIMAKAGCAFELMELAGLEPSRIRPSIRHHASDSATMLAMVRAGFGITLLPRMMLPKQREEVMALSLDPPQHVQIGLAVLSQKTASRGARLFLQMALAWVQESAFLQPHAR